MASMAMIDVKHESHLSPNNPQRSPTAIGGPSHTSSISGSSSIMAVDSIRRESGSMSHVTGLINGPDSTGMSISSMAMTNVTSPEDASSTGGIRFIKHSPSSASMISPHRHSSVSVYSPQSPDGSNSSTISISSSSKATIYRTRPIRSCTHCRQQKIRCNASETYPNPCRRCSKMDRECKVDPYFKPQKGGQVQVLRDDITSLRQQLQQLQRRETVIGSDSKPSAETSGEYQPFKATPDFRSFKDIDSDTNETVKRLSTSSNSTTSPLPIFPTSTLSPAASMASPPPQRHVIPRGSVPISTMISHDKVAGSSLPLKSIQTSTPPSDNSHASPINIEANSIANPAIVPPAPQPPVELPESFTVGAVTISLAKADELHERFMSKYWPYLPIIQSNSATELHAQSKLLFWSVCLTASLSEPDPSLYNSLCNLIKHMAIETCWFQTPRSTHIVQALLILGTWPLPNEKVLDDCSFRFIGLAKTLSMQLGLHRGKFIYEFSRSQVSLRDAVKWRTRTWICTFFLEQIWAANLGLPANMPVDYLIEKSRTDQALPPSFRACIVLSIFCSKLVGIMGSSVTSPDGLIEPKNRCFTLYILEQELDRIVTGFDMTEPIIETLYLYMKLMICCFAFLPETPLDDQTRYIVIAFHTATRVVTLISAMSEGKRLIEIPVFLRHPVSFSAFILFRLHLSPLLPQQYVESARQSVVTVHRLFRNMLTAWKDVENDISRTAKVLEKLNFVIITHPYLFTGAPSIISRMRSHLTASMFYELIWAIHEARRRGGTSTISHTPKRDGPNGTDGNGNSGIEGGASLMTAESVPPLPFYNQITKDDFTTSVTTMPNGTTITTLVPTNGNGLPGYPFYGGSGNNGHGMTSAAIVSHEGSRQPSEFPSSGPNIINQLESGMPSLLDSTGSTSDPLHLDTLMQGIDWMDGQGDDFLGWMDMNFDPSF